MKKVIVIGLMAVLALYGCQVKEIGELTPVREAKVFTATIEDDAFVETKTSLDNYGNVLWKMGDQVSIFAGSTINEQYQVTDASDGETAASLYQVTTPGFVAGTDIDNNVAFYPYAATVSISKRESAYILKRITLPSIQYYAEGSFGNGAFPMTAVTSSPSDYNLKFKNVLGGLKLQLKGTATIASISITGNGNEILCGAAEVTVINGGVPSISLTDATAKTVTLDCGNGVLLNAETATPFIIALPAMTMEGGFTVTVTDTEGKQMEIKTTKSQTIARSRMLKMPAVTYEGTLPVVEHQYVDLGLPSGLKWATCNVGANAPEEYGDYFAWGETEPYYSSQDPLTWKDGKTGYDLASYSFALGTDYPGPFSKYVTDAASGTVDNKILLDPEDDAARVNWGGNWRMPTKDEWAEIRTNCTWTWTTLNGLNGQLVTGPNGNSIFLPAAGGWFFTERDRVETGHYWSSSLCSSWDGQFVVFGDKNFGPNYFSYGLSPRFYGYSIRPVTDEGVRVSVTGVTLDCEALNLEAGSTATLSATVTPSDATQPAVIWSSSDTSVATVDYTGRVTAVNTGSATITATTYDGGLTATCEITVTAAVPQQISGEENGHYYVDLGLPSGLKWATCNVGANSREEYGDYFAWGETEPYYSSLDPLTWRAGKEGGYSWTSYTWCNGSETTLTKYNTSSDYGPVVDNKLMLDLEDDAARANWGGSWRMPTNEEIQELLDNCTTVWVIRNGVIGRKFTGSNGNSIFFPAAGTYTALVSTGFWGNGYIGYYWSSSLYSNSQSSRLDFGSDFVKVYPGGRLEGYPVRPVIGDSRPVPVTSVNLNVDRITMAKGETQNLVAAVNPLYATNKSVTWSSSDPNVATVSDSGVVTALDYGMTTITVTTVDGGFSASCEVTVGFDTNRTRSIIVDLGTINNTTLPYSTTAHLSNIYESIGLNVDALNRVYGSPVCTSHVQLPSGVTINYDSNIGWIVQFDNMVEIGTVCVTYTFAPKSNYSSSAFPFICYSIRWDINDGISPEYVDLGLPSGLKWATCNVGATAPEEYGDYFAWGETEPKNNYDWSTYLWCNGSGNTLTKYNTDSSYGTVDNKTTLDLEDDAARANWGGSWRMPTHEEFQELLDNCTIAWITQNGVNGRKFTSNNNGNSIFLPAAGCQDEAGLEGTGAYGFYWSSSLSTGSPSSARCRRFTSVYVFADPNGRCDGFPVRPVKE